MSPCWPVKFAVVLLPALLSVGCGRAIVPRTQAASFTKSAADQPPEHRQVRATGVIHAIHSITIQTPQIAGLSGRLTLTNLAPNGAKVAKGDIIAAFDRTQQLDNAMQAKAKFDDLSHQVDQRLAQNQSDAEKRSADLQKAEGDLAKADLELRKGPLLSEIDRLKNDTKADAPRAHVARLKKSNHFHDLPDASALRILELQRDRQKVALDRSEPNAAWLGITRPRTQLEALQASRRHDSIG